MVSFPNGRRVTLLRRAVTGQDSDGNDVYTTSQIVVDGCAVWPGGSSEQNQGRDTVTIDVTVLLPAGTAVVATDQVRIDEKTYEINGEPAEWKSALSSLDAGVQVELLRVTG